jgi:preprotein translocase subunit YajC
MCKQTLENAEQAATAARGMNTAIAVLFLPPVMMFVGIFTLIYRQRNKQDEE